MYDGARVGGSLDVFAGAVVGELSKMVQLKVYDSVQLMAHPLAVR